MSASTKPAAAPPSRLSPARIVVQGGERQAAAEDRVESRNAEREAIVRFARMKGARLAHHHAEMGGEPPLRLRLIHHRPDGLRRLLPGGERKRSQRQSLHLDKAAFHAGNIAAQAGKLRPPRRGGGHDGLIDGSVLSLF